MLKIIKEKWDKNESLLRETLTQNDTLNRCSYLDLVKIAFAAIFNDEQTSGCEALDLDEITEIDNGDYQGTLLYLIPFKTYQPSEYEYIMTYVGYGSCSGCDTLQSIQGFEDKEPTENQIKEFMALCKDILTNSIKPYNGGWRKNEDYNQVEM